MELRHLRYFVAVAEAEHLGRAAEQLRVSASPLSRQIAQLEEEVGVPLLQRVGRGVKLSAAGRAFLEGARDTLARATLAVESARAASRGAVGTINVGFEGGIAYTALLPKVMSTFRKRHAGVDLRLLSVESEQQSAALRDGRIAIGYQYLYGPASDPPSIRSRTLFRDRLGVVLPREHRLARASSVRLADLKDEHVFWPSRAVHPSLDSALRTALLAQRGSLTIHEENDGETLLTLVASGAGISFVSESAAAFIRIRATYKRVRDLDIVTLGRVVWQAADQADVLVRSVLEITREVHRV